MKQLTVEHVLTFLLSYAAIALAAGIAVLLVLASGRRARGPLLPPQRQRAVPWNILIVLVAFILCVVVEGVIAVLLGVTGPTADIEQTRRLYLAHTVAAPLQVLVMLAVLWGLSGAQLYQVGLTAHRWRKDVVAGYLTWLVITPAVTGIYWLVRFLEPAGEHDLEKLVRVYGDDPGTWLLVIVSAVVAAPLTEELLIRGIVQPWMVRQPAGSDFAVIIVTAAALAAGIFEMTTVGRLESWGLLAAAAAAPAYLGFEAITRRWLPRPGAARAIYASSLVFAALHYDVWPTPVPLFFLSLALGYLAYRTQSLVGPILVHSLFNAVSLTQLPIEQMVSR